MGDDKAQPRFFLFGQPVDAPVLAPGLYVVATPIGNLGDISIRALQTLAAVDTILCEDTRHSARLLDHYGIKTRRKALHEHNEREEISSILARIKAGASMALISDAGTPLLSDPGFPLVRALQGEEVPVFPVPGASALLAALSAAGLPTDSFSFFGFLPAKAVAREKAIAALADRMETLLFYESPRRLDVTLTALRDGLGAEREAVVALELTKRFERLEKGRLAALVERFAGGETKGEAVIVVAGASEAPAGSEEDWQKALASSMGEMSLREAVDLVAARFNLKRKQVYDAALAYKARQ